MARTRVNIWGHFLVVARKYKVKFLIYLLEAVHSESFVYTCTRSGVGKNAYIPCNIIPKSTLLTRRCSSVTRLSSDGPLTSFKHWHFHCFRCSTAMEGLEERDRELEDFWNEFRILQELRPPSPRVDDDQPSPPGVGKFVKLFSRLITFQYSPAVLRSTGVPECSLAFWNS